MRRYIMKQQLFEGDSYFVVKTEDGQEAYLIDRQTVAHGHQLSFKDVQGREHARIQQKHSAWGPLCEIYRQGNLCAVVTKHHFSLFRCRFTVDVPGPNDLEATGTFMDREYSFLRSNQTVATVSRKWRAQTNSFLVEISESEDDVLILACVSVLDFMCHSD